MQGIIENVGDAVKVLWLGKRFYTNKDALREQFGRMYRVPQRWQHEGAQVALWLVDYHTREIIRENDAGMGIASAPLLRFESLRQVLRAIATRRARYIIASGDCYVGLLGWVLARLSGAYFVFDVYDKYDEFAGYRRFRCFDLFAFLLKRADRLMFASKSLALQVGAGLCAPIHVAPNGVDSTVFGPRDMLMCRHELGLPERTLFIGYFGSMEPDRGVADLIEACGRMRANGTPVELLLAGNAGSNLSFDTPGTRYLGMVPHKLMPVVLNACDVLVVPYRLSPVMDMGASCKIAEYLACRRPLVATTTPNFLANFPVQASLMGQALCRSSDPDDMARALAYQLESRVIQPMVENMTWESIADSALRWLHAGDVSDPAVASLGPTDGAGK